MWKQKDAFFDLAIWYVKRVPLKWAFLYHQIMSNLFLLQNSSVLVEDHRLLQHFLLFPRHLLDDLSFHLRIGELVFSFWSEVFHYLMFRLCHMKTLVPNGNWTRDWLASILGSDLSTFLIYFSDKHRLRFDQATLTFASNPKWSSWRSSFHLYNFYIYLILNSLWYKSLYQANDESSIPSNEDGEVSMQKTILNSGKWLALGPWSPVPLAIFVH